jgi:hypothetical protein
MLGCSGAVLCVGPRAAWAQKPALELADEPRTCASPPCIDPHVILQNLFLLRSDSDFDPTAPAYDAQGQSIGAFATVFKPGISFWIAPSVRLYYEAELGLNYWSKQNPDQQDPLAPSIFVLKHREVFAQGDFADRTIGFKVGYSRFIDPTDLFLNHWIGNAQLSYGWTASDRVTAFIAQLPDSTYEGINVSDSNFSHDIFVAGALAALVPAEHVKLNLAALVLRDTHVVGQSRTVGVPAVHLAAEYDTVALAFDGLLQVGRFDNATPSLQAQTLLAWSAQAHAFFNAAPVRIDLNLLALSPDDVSAGNTWNYAALYSGKSHSATLMLTEDKIRDWYDNIDERLSTYAGGFYTNRAGLFVGDVRIGATLLDVLRPALVLGAAATLQSRNSLDRSFVGFESDVLLDYQPIAPLTLTAAFGALIPGSAAAALVNMIDINQNNPVFMAEASLLLRY